MQKLVELTKERNALANQAKKVPQLEAEVEDLKHSIAFQCSVHQIKAEGLRVAHKLEVEQPRSAHLGELELKDSTHKLEVKQLCSVHSLELKLKDSFCDVEKIHVLIEL